MHIIRQQVIILLDRFGLCAPFLCRCGGLSRGEREYGLGRGYEELLGRVLRRCLKVDHERRLVLLGPGCRVPSSIPIYPPQKQKSTFYQ